MFKTTIQVQNLKCGGCAHTIEQRLQDLQYVKAVSVDKDLSTVQVTMDNSDKENDLRGLLSNLGYPAINEENTFGKKAKSFVSCAIGKISS